MPYPYEVFDLPETASQEEIRAQYLRLVRRYPPEQYPTEFQEIARAYELLKDEVKRTELRLFGLKIQDRPQKLQDFAVSHDKARKKAGAELWLALIRDTKVDEQTDEG